MAFRTGKGGHIVKGAVLTVAGTTTVRKIFTMSKARLASISIGVTNPTTLSSTVNLYASNRPLDGLGAGGINPEAAVDPTQFTLLVAGLGWAGVEGGDPAAAGNFLALVPADFAVYMVEIIVDTAGGATFDVFLNQKDMK